MGVSLGLIAKNVMDGKKKIITIRIIKQNYVTKIVKFNKIAQNCIKMRFQELIYN